MADGSQPLTRRPSARQVRAVLETALERLLSTAEAVLADLDALDADADLEPGLGSPEVRTNGMARDWRAGDWAPFNGVDQTRWAAGATDDREDDDEREPDVDDEHPLGWESHGSQRTLEAGANDGEPSLGWPERMDQARDRRSHTDHDDEPTMGSLGGTWPFGQLYWSGGYDREDSEREVVSEDEGSACEDEGAITGDDEPWLNPPQGPGSADFRDLEGASTEIHSQGGRMVSDDGRSAYWRPGIGERGR